MLLKNGLYVNLEFKKIEKKDIRILDGIITEIEDELKFVEDEEILELANNYILPSFVDLHAHFREPGFEEKETLECGAKAAISSGYTDVCIMPNTNPILDNKEIVKWLDEKAKKITDLNIHVVGAISKNEKGNELVDFREYRNTSVKAVSDDGQPVWNQELLKQAMKQAKKEKLVVMLHCEKKELVHGSINKGVVSEMLGDKGINNASEYLGIKESLELAKEMDAAIHICHISTKESVEIIRKAKLEGIKVTCEVTPNHIALNEMEVISQKSIGKINPPLRTKLDQEYLIKGLKDGVIDAIGTDHAPHTKSEKEESLSYAPFGISTLDIAASIVYTHLVDQKIIDLFKWAEIMAINPRRIIGLESNHMKIGEKANLCVFNSNDEYIVEAENMYSKGKNTPFIGKKLKGIVEYTIKNGNIIYRR